MTDFPSPTKPTKEQRRWLAYERLAQRTLRKNSDYQWRIGDVALLGKKQFPETYTQALTGIYGKTEGTIRNYERVCERFPTPRERAWDVDFGWYKEVYAKDADTINDILTRVEAGEFENREQLREELRGQSDKPKPVKTACKVIDLVAVLTSPEFGFKEDDIIDITAKLVEFSEQEKAA